MIVLKRIKYFTRRDYLPENEQFDEDIPSECNIIFNIQRTKKFLAQFKDQMPGDQEIIRSLIKDIKAGYYYSDGPSGGDTHWLKDFSHKGRSHMMSKKVNYHDRLNYRVYKPSLEYDEDGNLLPTQTLKIVLESCADHGRNGAKNYSAI